MSVKLGLEMQAVDTLEMQLICNCCRQPYDQKKGWEDRLRAVMFGTERFAICPICTQSPPEDVFNSYEYRNRCVYEVRRLQRMYEAARRRSPRAKDTL